MPATGLLKICELDETHAKLLTVSMATFRENKQALYGIFCMFLQLPIHCKNSITIHAKLLYTLEAVKETKVDTLISTTHAYCSS